MRVIKLIIISILCLSLLFALFNTVGGAGLLGMYVADQVTGYDSFKDLESSGECSRRCFLENTWGWYQVSPFIIWGSALYIAIAIFYFKNKNNKKKLISILNTKL